ncbi:MAG: LemA family protein [Candidatus Woesearchaeota archaeon]|nr:LemA family protein [Candidatus Woesearchaeota archaeon]
MAKKGMNVKNMKGLWIAGAIVFVVLLLLGWFVGSYNMLVTLNNNVDNKWAQVETVYQRRADLIPNLINTVQGAVNFERETQTKIAELRTQASAIKSEMQSAKTPSELDAAGQKLDGVVKGYQGLNINVENYPQLKATANFLALQDELANTENKVAVERQRYNDAVKDINIAVQRFPTNVVAGIFGFKQREYFQSAAGSENVPEVKF